MKHYHYHYLVVLFVFLFSVNVYAETKQVDVEGKWGDELIRTSAPELPVVSIDGNLLSIYLADALENLTIVIADSNGFIVYQDCISSNEGGYTYPIWLSKQPGSYTIEISHSYGTLNGMFTVNP
ncbi:MAG: DUF3244 domain-containing protein [Tannerellaceae bacterium]|jgi:hypothetical protein|nr:DUF3244 domain-containing protein [Tannerellaceae bacterium]